MAVHIDRDFHFGRRSHYSSDTVRSNNSKVLHEQNTLLQGPLFHESVELLPTKALLPGQLLPPPDSLKTSLLPHQ